MVPPLMVLPSQDEEFPDTLALWPDKEVTELVNTFRSTFPKQTRRGALKGGSAAECNFPIFSQEFVMLQFGFNPKKQAHTHTEDT